MYRYLWKQPRAVVNLCRQSPIGTDICRIVSKALTRLRMYLHPASGWGVLRRDAMLHRTQVLAKFCFVVWEARAEVTHVSAQHALVQML
jgi:hypothetical protein